ncbi:MAG: hypothetical protein ACUVWP_08610 [bacterium]
MAQAYTPGLKVVEETVVIKERKLPLAGEVIVKEGDEVKAIDIVARTFLPGNIVTVNVANKMSLPPEDVPTVMIKKEGDDISANEIIAQQKAIFGLFTSRCTSPVSGKIESISGITGQVIIREPPNPVQINAYINGWVRDVIPREGVRIETQATFIQGIFGIGGEVHGEIEVVCKTPSEVFDKELIKDEHKGKILVGGSLVTLEAIERARDVGVIGIVVGGMNDWDLRKVLGYDLGVAITGKEEIGLTVIVTEGFGEIKMANTTFELLKKRNGFLASMNGATQIRAGVIRPEIVIPLGKKPTEEKREERPEAANLVVGSKIRAIREPYFGMIGEVVELPSELTKLETEATVRILKACLENGETVILPRANVELIESE